MKDLPIKWAWRIFSVFSWVWSNWAESHRDIVPCFVFYLSGRPYVSHPSKHPSNHAKDTFHLLRSLCLSHRCTVIHEHEYIQSMHMCTSTHTLTHRKYELYWEGALYWVFFRKYGSSKALVRWKAKSCIDRPRAWGWGGGESLLSLNLFVCVCVCWVRRVKGRACSVSPCCRAASQARSTGPVGWGWGAGSELSLWFCGSSTAPWSLSGGCTLHTQSTKHAYICTIRTCTHTHSHTHHDGSCQRINWHKRVWDKRARNIFQPLANTKSQYKYTAIKMWCIPSLAIERYPQTFPNADAFGWWSPHLPTQWIRM